MAEYNPERAFLESLAADPSGGYATDSPGQQQPVTSDEDEDYDPSNLMPSTDYPSHLPKSAAGSVSPAPSASVPVSPPADADSPTNQAPSEASEPVTQQRIVGGFVVESSDDEGDLPSVKPRAADAALRVGGRASRSPQRSISSTPSNTLPKTNVHIHSASQDQGGSGAHSTGLSDPAPSLASVVPVAAVSAHENQKSPPVASTPVPEATPAPQAAASSQPQARLPLDRIGILEDRIKEDPRGDMDAWLSLISEYRKRNKFDEVRAVYDRFFKVFPTAAEEWVNYCNMELQNDDFYRVEQIFMKSIQSNHHLQLWSTYLDYVRRRNDLSSDPEGKARAIVQQAFDFVLGNVGIDKDAGNLWQEYLSFIKSAPGSHTSGDWQDLQKMDRMRKAYQRAICIPTQQVQNIWKQYDQFEMGLNKAAGRKFLQEKSAAYMTARSANIKLENITKDLIRTTRPHLPPAPGFDGDVEYLHQVEIWKNWISWEKEDPLVLKEDDPPAFHQRVLYAYKQALMALRFWPEMWYDAAEFCYQNDLVQEGDAFLLDGANANPESSLLAFKRADRIELTHEPEEGEEGVKRRGDAVREPYNKLLDALYDLVKKTKEREERTIARVKEMHAQNAPQDDSADEDDDDEEEGAPKPNAREAALQMQIRAIEAGNNAQTQLLSKIISYAWIGLMRAMRRIQGKGKPNGNVGGFRQIFAEARKKGRVLSEVYVTSALIEYHCYKDPAATKIFERGMKLFPNDENFALEYLKHLIAINDITNARAVFETTVSKLTQKPETVPRAKPIFSFFHEYESQYGELSQITKLEKRMGDLFPEDPQLARFSHRYSSPTFDPTIVRPIISPATQSKPKGMPPMPMPMQQPSAPPMAAPIQMQMPLPPNPMAVPTIEETTPAMNHINQAHSDPSRFQNGQNMNSPRPPPAVAAISNSPKRPFMFDDDDGDAQPRKLQRGESPLKGAAGRRLDAARRNQAQQGGQSHFNVPQAPQPSLPRELTFLLSIIPGAHTYRETRFIPERLVDLIRNTDMDRTGPPPVVGPSPVYNPQYAPPPRVQFPGAPAIPPYPVPGMYPLNNFMSPWAANGPQGFPYQR
ncbi:uncharacterized protein BDZ99DRAFT_550397 [Mytilinidion resinicola]|uniref:mRNA 3'-end-processing protein RNA14 n=1 Tax=Mytilinidion resinicola TaxID=574789 RepID=A0A6A6Z4E0_9PEZI|nr:uncharacterized protein BDZ99DRAFT_550397 [Mytilinidion resinicola]KAF2815523.1 hypothetical protein BDZ99DRAFT_550397 [Mytilinidion resinicola]